MGSKIAAKELMAAAGVPVLPGVTITGDDPPPAGEIKRIGYPLLVKAAFGGGGRGMRVVTRGEDLGAALAGACREAAAAFGDGTVFCERYLDAPRHIEVQIFGDSHGNVVHLFERECSIQRRYQKIIEEAPSPAVHEDLRRELGEAAVAAGKAIGYTGAGTVEFVLADDNRFYFLEVNTRLQVEHPVTELVTGLDLVALQLQVAAGEPLPDEVAAAALTGHAIEARLYAEDTDAGFLPCTGTVHTFEVPDRSGLRVDAGIADGSQVGLHYDAMLAKIIAFGPTRDAARRRLARALAETRLHGVTSNRDLLVGILREEEFAAGRIDTGYLTRHDPRDLAASARTRPRRGCTRWPRRWPGRPPGEPPRRCCGPSPPAGATCRAARSTPRSITTEPRSWCGTSSAEGAFRRKLTGSRCRNSGCGRLGRTGWSRTSPGSAASSPSRRPGRTGSWTARSARPGWPSCPGSRSRARRPRPGR